MHMGSTDRYNQDTNLLRIGIRGKKWWWPLFTWLLDATIVNAWKLHQGNMSQLQFRREITAVYLRRYGIPADGRGRKSGLQSNILNQLRFDKINHIVIPTPKRRRCAGSSVIEGHFLPARNVMWDCAFSASSHTIPSDLKTETSVNTRSFGILSYKCNVRHCLTCAFSLFLQ